LQFGLGEYWRFEKKGRKATRNIFLLSVTLISAFIIIINNNNMTTGFYVTSG